MEYSAGLAVLVSQSTDKLTRFGPDFLGIYSRTPWEVCAGTVSRGFSAGSTGGLAQGWCG